MSSPQRAGGLGDSWVVHGMGSPGQATIEHAELACDPAYADFMTARLTEELARTTREQARQVLREVLAELRDGRIPDDVTLHLLATAYADHPDFRAQWRSPDLLLAEPSHGRR